jgi:hypothetical protein
MNPSNFTDLSHVSIVEATGCDVRTRIELILQRQWDGLAATPVSRNYAGPVDLLMTALQQTLDRCHELTVLDLQIERAVRCLGRWVMLNGGELPEMWVGDGRGPQEAERDVRIDPFALGRLYCSGSLSRDAQRALAGLSEAVRHNDTRAIHAIFVELGRLGPRVGALGPLRAHFIEYARENYVGLPTFAFEFAVLETRLDRELGWENARAYISLVAALEPKCTAALREFMEPPDLIEAASIYRMMSDRIPVWHFDLLRRGWTTEPLKRLHQRVRVRASIPLATPPAAAPAPGMARSGPASWWVRLALRLFDRARPGAALRTSPATS